jgi:hypothetical protein
LERISFRISILLYNISFLFGDVGWQVEGISSLGPSLKMKRFKEQSASIDASVKRQLDTELSAVKLNETATNLDDDSGLVNNINQGANIMV